MKIKNFSMPQFELLSFFNQSFYFLSFGSFIFLFVLKQILPTLFYVSIYRKKILIKNKKIQLLKPYTLR